MFLPPTLNGLFRLTPGNPGGRIRGVPPTAAMQRPPPGGAQPTPLAGGSRLKARRGAGSQLGVLATPWNGPSRPPQEGLRWKTGAGDHALELGTAACWPAGGRLGLTFLTSSNTGIQVLGFRSIMMRPSASTFTTVAGSQSQNEVEKYSTRSFTLYMPKT